MKYIDLARNNISTLVYGNGGGRRPAVDAMSACTISADSAARRVNFEIAKQAELILQHRKVIFKKQLYHIDQHKKWTCIICFVAY